MRWIVFSNAYVALCGAALTAATYTLLGEPPRAGWVAAMVFCCTLVIYNLDRLVEPHPGDSEHEQWVHRHRPLLWAVTLAGVLGAAACTAWLPLRAIVSLPIAGTVAFGYCLPVVRYGGRWHRLKELPGAKLLLIAGVWAYATAGLPMLDVGRGLDLESAAVLVARLLFLGGVALPFDLPDMQRDRQSGIKTLPTMLGVNATRRAAIGLALLSAVLGLMNPWPGAWAVSGAGAVAFAVVFALRADRGLIYFMVLLDGMLLLQAAGLWITAGL